ncbi:OmpA family protein [uncultured Porphyromonas sp.]|uniref:OmpA family protein n=1 Tax=uncultured Porphyromonas sp. TaxID=159274 RepID=UPI0025F7D125|nr:OmpA family protein [uncultured Porphyromonas sp.]
MTKKSIIVGLCVILLSAAVSTPVEAQRDRRQAPRQKRDRTERVERSERDRREKEVVMTKQELATLINAIVTAAEEDEMNNTCPQQRDITITNNKDRDLLYLLLQYHNLNAMKATPVYTQSGQPINVGGQLYYPAGSNLVVAQGAQRAQATNDADKIKALEEELTRLKAAQQNPQRDDDQIAQQLAALRNQLNELEKASEKAPVYNYDNRRVIHQDRSRNNVQLSRSVFFKVNSDVINAEGLEAVRNVADFVINDPRALVLVYGYASIDGPVDFNNRLAAKRAASVIKALQEAGVPAAAIKRYDNGVDTTPAKRTDARRVDMDVIY